MTVDEAIPLSLPQQHCFAFWRSLGLKGTDEMSETVARRMARDAAQELVDAGALTVDVHGKPSVARLPANGFERQLFRRALGLRLRSEDDE